MNIDEEKQKFAAELVKAGSHKKIPRSPVYAGHGIDREAALERLKCLARFRQVPTEGGV